MMAHTMSAPKIDNTITTGNMLSICTILVAAGVAWGVVNSDVAALRRSLDQQATRTEQVAAAVDRAAAERTAQLSAQEARVRTLEAVAARDGARLDAILQSLARIEARLDRSGQ